MSQLPPAPPALPVAGHAVPFVSDPFGFVAETVEESGDAFRMRLFGRDIYVLAHPDYVETALTDRETFGKLDDFRVAFGDALLSTEGEQWQRQRHAMEGFFSPRRIQEYAETIQSITEGRIDGWESGQRVRLDEEMQLLALETLFEVVMGHTPEDETTLAELAADAHALNLWFKPTSWALPDWVPTPARYRFRKGSDRLRSWASSLLSEAGTTPGEESLLATLATLRDDPDSGFDRAEVLDQVVGMLFAGHETTALAMTYALHQLGRNPAVADRLVAALDAEASVESIRELPVLDRIVTETLRLYPPVHGLPRITTDRAEVGEYAIPADSEVLLAVWNIHRDGRFYDDPTAFRPDRWTDTTPRARGYEYVPFGAGPRICIGRHLSRLEMKIALATICRRFRIDPDGPVAVSPQMTTQPDGPVEVTLERRE